MMTSLMFVRFLFGSDRSGFCLGSVFIIIITLMVYAVGIHASLSIGPGGEFPSIKDVFFYALSHDDTPSLLVSVSLLILFGPHQERRWGTVAMLALSLITMIILPLVYTLVIFVGGVEASRISGFSAIQLALFTAQSRQAMKRKVFRCLPVWLLPWIFLLIGLLVLPGTPALLHFCAICIGHNYGQSVIKMLQELEEMKFLDLIPEWLFVPSARFRLPTYTIPQRPFFNLPPVDQSPLMPASTSFQHQTWVEPLPAWIAEESAALSEADMLEEQMLRAGILASLEDSHEELDAKVEVPKSSVSSLRLQQLEKMGFPTEKAVVALAASKQLDGAISLLIEDSIGEKAVVVSKGKNPPPSESS